MCEKDLESHRNIDSIYISNINIGNTNNTNNTIVLLYNNTKNTNNC